MVAQDISRKGIGFLYAHHVKPGSHCSLILPGRDGGMFGVHGTVRACTRTGLVLYRIGLEFEEPLDPERILPAEQVPAE